LEDATASTQQFALMQMAASFPSNKKGKQKNKVPKMNGDVEYRMKLLIIKANTRKEGVPTSFHTINI
jgi:hypothetical protein